MRPRLGEQDAKILFRIEGCLARHNLSTSWARVLEQLLRGEFDMETIASLPRMSRERLSAMLLSPCTQPLAIIDVRDDDHLGGHIHTSMHVPSQTLDYKIPELVRILADKKIVVFHCALSQQRGPGAALKYLRERGRRTGKTQQPRADETEERPSMRTRSKEAIVKDLQPEGVVQGAEGGKCETSKGEGSPKAEGAVKRQEVYVLDGGFVKWQEMCASAL